MIETTKEQLKYWYIEENLSGKEIAEKLGCCKTWAVKLLKKYNLVEQKSKEDRKRHTFENVAKTNLEKYGSISPLGNEGIKQKSKQTCLKKYGSEHISHSTVIREKIRKTNLEKYGSETPFGNKKIQKKIAEKFSTGKPQQKCNETKRANGTFNTSEDEEQAYHMLVEKFGYTDVFRQHKTKEYPFPCDFYIKSLNLYLEYQGSWVHGGEIYNPSKIEHQKEVNRWQSKGTEYFDYAIKVWTERDPEKRRVAKENHLSWIEFFNLEDLEQWLSHS